MSVVAIPLTRGYVATIDATDEDLIGPYKWTLSLKVLPCGRDLVYAHGVLRDDISVNVLMHRLIMGFPAGEVDHVDGYGLNNTRANLRLATSTQNQANRP
jgi:hypothetical protein